MLNLKIIITSTRPGRKGPSMAQWMFELASKQEGWNVGILDLKEIGLPMMDEANHPRFRKYEHEHTKKWSAMVDSADAFIIVTPEYNHGFTAPLKNALDYLHQEWGYKPVSFISYGGVSAGTRAVQMVKPILTALKMMPIPEGIHIPMFTSHIDEQGKFNAAETLDKAALDMLAELKKWSLALKPMRQ